MSDEELLKTEKTLKLFITMGISAAVLMLAVGIWLSIVKHKFSALTAIPMSMGVIVIVNANSLKTIQKEKKSRGLL
ncbi:hypothetical protein [Xanthocytophaga flava]|uniref:hypothetical protein n=1 Tax=Xanthocytophaga flava TaxID=3048013 RepID=UPI0028D577E2|nr:hypothetical protein [Xanthocytophaga flavus]MDJ1469019.1 hypothetical protein [Xanthocytophaga flavus]